MSKTGKTIVGGWICLLVWFFPITGVAEKTAEKETESAALISGLSYDLVYPDNQQNKALGYYDFKMNAGEKQIISLRLFNAHSEELTVAIRLNSAKTNSQGVIEYGPSELEADDSLRYDLAELVEWPEEVTIPPQGEKQVDFVIQLPEEEFSGVLAGGIQLQPQTKEPVTEAFSKTDQVLTEFAFLIGLRIQIGDTGELTPSLTLNQSSAALKDKQSYLLVNVSNTAPVYLEELTVDVDVRQAETQTSVFTYRKSGLRMAPNSRMELPIALADKEMTSGDYTAVIRATAKQGQRWEWQELFTVSQLVAEQTRSVGSTAFSWFNRWMGLGLLGLLLVGAWLFYWRLRAATQQKRKQGLQGRKEHTQ